MIIDLNNLPYGLSQVPNIQKIKTLHAEAFHSIVTNTKPQNFDDCKELTKILKKILHAHNFIVPHIACGIHESHFPSEELSACPYLNAFLYKYLTRRIGIRMLMAQQISLLAQYMNPELRVHKNFVGEIDGDIDLENVVRSSYEKARQLCINKYGAAPNLVVVNKKRIPLNMYLDMYN
eukprot:UN33604